jgi:hypothetical protein
MRKFKSTRKQRIHHRKKLGYRKRKKFGLGAASFKKNKITRERRPEIKYSPVFESTNQTIYTYTSATAQPWSILSDCWPSTGTGKQQMLGTQIFMRKIIINLSFENTKTNGSQQQVRIMVIKSEEALNSGRHYVDLFDISAGSSTDYPRFFQSIKFGHLTRLRQGNGSIIYDKLITPKIPNSQPSDWTTSQTSTFKYKRIIIRVNRKYFKDTIDSTKFNRCYYYLAIVEDPNTSGYYGSGLLYNVNYGFTYQDA